MATFTAGDKGGAMYNFEYGPESYGIDSIVINGSTAVVTVGFGGNNPALTLTFTGTGFTAEGRKPTGGTFTSVSIERNGHLGTISDIAPGALFKDIHDHIALDRIFDGDDTLIGGSDVDGLYGGNGGTDIFHGNGGDDFLSLAAHGAPTHLIDGGTGKDQIDLRANGDGTPSDLRSATIISVEALYLAPDANVILNASQFGAGLSPGTRFEGFKIKNEPLNTVEVFKDIAGPLDFRGLVVHDAQFVIHGTAADDVIYATRGRDAVNGGDGNDLLAGGRRADVLTGGIGSDTFDLDQIKESLKPSPKRDTITDFEHLVDHIDVSTIDANGGLKGNKAFKLRPDEGDHFTHKAGQLIWHRAAKQGITVIDGDVNGDGKSDFRIDLTGLVTLTRDDFVL